MLNTEEKTQAIVSALEDVKALDITVIDTSRLSPLFERMVVASAQSTRQTKALANNVVVKLKELGETVNSTEGEDSGEWVLVDLGEVIVHIMQPAVRAYYNLEELWGVQPGPRGRAPAPEGSAPPRHERAKK
jgi:ribosome-associated protein